MTRTERKAAARAKRTHDQVDRIIKLIEKLDLDALTPAEGCSALDSIRIACDDAAEAADERAEARRRLHAQKDVQRG